MLINTHEHVRTGMDYDKPSPSEIDTGVLEAVKIDRDEALSSDDDWNWADEQWQSDVTTPQSLEASQIGLCARNGYEAKSGLGALSFLNSSAVAF